MRVAPVELTTADGIVLRGQRWNQGRDWLLLHHDSGRDIDSWEPLLPLVAERPEWSALAVDARGHGGSEGEWDTRASTRDIEAAVRYAQDHGARAVCVVGAGLSAIAALLACHGDDAPEALVLFSPGPLDGFDPAELRGQGLSKLIFVGALGEEEAAATAVLREKSIGQPLVVNFPTTIQGTDLLEGPWAIQALEHLAAFFDEQRVFIGAEAPRFAPQAQTPGTA